MNMQHASSNEIQSRDPSSSRDSPSSSSSSSSFSSFSSSPGGGVDAGCNRSSSAPRRTRTFHPAPADQPESGIRKKWQTTSRRYQPGSIQCILIRRLIRRPIQPECCASLHYSSVSFFQHRGWIFWPTKRLPSTATWSSKDPAFHPPGECRRSLQRSRSHPHWPDTVSHISSPILTRQAPPAMPSFFPRHQILIQVRHLHTFVLACCGTDGPIRQHATIRVVSMRRLQNGQLTHSPPPLW